MVAGWDAVSGVSLFRIIKGELLSPAPTTAIKDLGRQLCLHAHIPLPKCTRLLGVSNTLFLCNQRAKHSTGHKAATHSGTGGIEWKHREAAVPLATLATALRSPRESAG